TIAPTSALPTITDPVMIDGYTQPGASANTLGLGTNAALRIELSGKSAAKGVDGLVIAAGGCTVRGLVIHGFQPAGGAGGAAIRLQGPGGNVIAGCFLGTDPTGKAAAGNYRGVAVDGCPRNTIGGTTLAAVNLISGNAIGIYLAGEGATENV